MIKAFASDRADESFGMSVLPLRCRSVANAHPRMRRVNASVPTISFRLLYGLLILRHDRRRILWRFASAARQTGTDANRLSVAPLA